MKSDEGDQMTDERFLALHSAIAGSHDDPASLTKALQPFSDEELLFAHAYKQLVETELLRSGENPENARNIKCLRPIWVDHDVIHRNVSGSPESGCGQILPDGRPYFHYFFEELRLDSKPRFAKVVYRRASQWLLSFTNRYITPSSGRRPSSPA